MKRICALSLIALFSCGLFAAKQKVDKVFNAAEIEKTAEIAPKELLKKPAKTRNILVFSRTGGYRHCDGIPAFNELMKAMEKNFNGAWKVTYTEDVSYFEPDTIKQFDCIVLNNTTNQFFGVDGPTRKELKGEARQKNTETNNRYLETLLKYVENGGGIMGLHAACDAQGGTKYVEMMGGIFAGHPWTQDNPEVTVVIEDKKSPLLKGLWENGEFKIQDEIYTYTEDSFNRKMQRVLMSLDYDRSPLKNPEIDAMTKTRRKTKDFGLAWIKTYGKGRIFYGAFGHRADVYMRNPELAEFYCRGIQFATGDLKLDTTPLGALKK